MKSSLFAAVLAVVLCAASCSGSGGELPEVTGAFGAEPNVVPRGPLPQESAHQTVISGEGLPIGADSLIVTRLASYDVDGSGEIGDPVFSNFQDGPDVLFTTADFTDIFLGDESAAEDWKDGGRLLVSVPGTEGAEAAEGASAPAGPASVHVIDILDHYVAGQTVPGEQAEAAEPPFGVDVSNNRRPRVILPDTPAPERLETVTLIEGDGEPVREGDRVVVQFAGVTWTTGQVFDSTWEFNGRPSAYSIGTEQVLPGWDEALPGVAVGSRVLLVLPPELAFGADGNPDLGIAEEETVMFTIDILGRH